MRPSLAAGPGPAGSLIFHSGYAQAVAAALIAALIISAVTVLLTRKRIAWRADLDIPVVLAPRTSRKQSQPRARRRCPTRRPLVTLGVPALVRSPDRRPAQPIRPVT